MNELLRDYSSKEDLAKRTVRELVLLVLNELRITTIRQLYQVICLDKAVSEKFVYRVVKKLVEKEYLDFIRIGNGRKYFLTEKGNQSISSFYVPVKNPDYHLNHFMQINDVLIDSLEITKQQPTFSYVETEQRAFFEMRDGVDFEQVIAMNVPDFQLHFEEENQTKRRFYFEVELSIKSKNRYLKEIFPWYREQLKSYPNDVLFYVTGNPGIYVKLNQIREYFINRYQYTEFERFYIIPQSSFKEEYELICSRIFREKD